MQVEPYLPCLETSREIHFVLVYNAVIYAMIYLVISQCPFAFVFDFFFLLMNFSGSVVSEQRYLPQMPVGQ